MAIRRVLPVERGKCYTANRKWKSPTLGVQEGATKTLHKRLLGICFFRVFGLIVRFFFKCFIHLLCLY